VTSLKAVMPPIATCMSVTLVHPAKAVGWKEMPFARNTHVVPTNTVLDSPGPPMGRGDLGSEPPFWAMLSIAILLWPLLFVGNHVNNFIFVAIILIIFRYRNMSHSTAVLLFTLMVPYNECHCKHVLSCHNMAVYYRIGCPM